MNARPFVRPFVKWAGGKSRLLKELVPYVPRTMRIYCEPFMGGAALFFAIAGSESKYSFKQALLVDSNEELVACYRGVRNCLGAVLKILPLYSYDKETYYKVREQDTRGMSDAERAARFIFLNRTCFNGLWRVNATGKFNVPFGAYKNPRIVDEARLQAASCVLQKAELMACDFMEALKELRAGDFAYLDPPYEPVSRTSRFTSYVPGGFQSADQQRLAEAFRTLGENGVRALLSNSDTPFVRSMYCDFTAYSVNAPRTIHADASRRRRFQEVLIQNWREDGDLEKVESYCG
ncbi:DNA adenine methylase [Pajaroellobacter abortibovis]|uniref:Site-specific DNA-methyltransferase (adenine-specific) n=1 Tax=Pajaroellobacter abortibovis TaxID=1882918 RepID=A0A1L6MYL7_9BACT|nr:DNA adenine methylase [Pajaroellobacter abortibovis]APS00508.1 hypothetical protein BCY86_07335 [Pajaroellobacter abortibovis]